LRLRFAKRNQPLTVDGTRRGFHPPLSPSSVEKQTQPAFSGSSPKYISKVI
jgi:hypothetical protein